MTKQEREVINRAYECIKKHPELGRIYKKDLVPLESYRSNGMVRDVKVKDKYSGRVIYAGETNESYYSAYFMEV